MRYSSSWRRSPRSWFAIRNLKPSGLRRSTPASLFQQRAGHSRFLFTSFISVALWPYWLDKSANFLAKPDAGYKVGKWGSIVLVALAALIILARSEEHTSELQSL